MRTMTTIAALATLLYLTAASHAEEAQPKEIHGLGGLSTDLKNENTIRKLYADFTAAWNKHDPKTMAGFWAIDGDHMEPDGRHAKGKQEVERLFTEEQKTVFKDSTINLTIETVWFPDAETALIDGTYTLSGVKDLQGGDVPTRRGHLTAILIREDNDWRVAAGRAMIPVPLTYREK
ncbi:MAG TPA: SgcJ/EcaC family oxidoreductase [Candidatus Bathyarchaeia archaeon]|nr:SgcJ/EcaC family oxidoreductase [Candidatus Bathyarchaeia archaeon]